MRNISEKFSTLRTATALTRVTMAPETFARLQSNDLPKKDVIAVARTAGVMAAKNTPLIIPYCHTVPLDWADLAFEPTDSALEIRATVTAVGKTGVEMEALTAASVAALTVYDMLKPVDKTLTIGELKLEEKRGGKSDFSDRPGKNFRAAVIVTSDGTARGEREDKSGRLIKERLHELGIADVGYVVLPDDEDRIRAELLRLCADGMNLVLTTGGTGLGPRDVTVEATRAVIERDMPAVCEAMRAYGQSRTPYAMLSRGLAGVRGKTVIVNFPGSSRGTVEGLNAVFPALLHVFGMLRGGGH